MAFTPRYLLAHENGSFFVFETNGHSYEYDIVSYCWGDEVEGYDCGIAGVTWPVTINEKKVKQFKKLMRRQDIRYMWVDSLCINQANKKQVAEEVSKMFQYYKQAQNCYLLIDTPKEFNPQRIADNLKLLDHIQSNVGGASMISDGGALHPRLEERRTRWADTETWIRDEMPKSLVRSAGIDVGVMNCYNTCINQVTSLFDNKYFTRVWTFQEMILGKNIQLVGVTRRKMTSIGSLAQWMELAYDCRDKSQKLYGWINVPRRVNTMSINHVLGLLADDSRTLMALQTMVKGIEAARTDIINGGQHWWVENQKGIGNIFSAISITPRECGHMPDLFRGLLGIFSGLFTPAEIETQISGDDIEKISFAFFKQLSTKTGASWTRLSLASRDRGEWDWIPVMEQRHDLNPIQQNASEVEEKPEGDSEEEIVEKSKGDEAEEEAEKAEGANVPQRKKPMKKNLVKTDIFAGVTTLGYLRAKGRTETGGLTGLLGKPRKLMQIHLKEVNPEFHFIFRGCNGGKKLSNGLFRRSQRIATQDQPTVVTADETGRRLAQCATVLGCLLDPGNNVLEYKNRLLYRLNPLWEVTDPSARPNFWPERCVSGTIWAEAACPALLRTHNMSMNYRLPSIASCESRLAQGSTAHISCELRVNCGCTVTAPFSLIFEALTAVRGSPLGGVAGGLDADDRITLRDGLGLVQIGDLGKTFNVVAFAGDPSFYRAHAVLCRSTKNGKPVPAPGFCPAGRALIRSDFEHRPFIDLFRNYGYVRTGAGNLLICRSHPLASYRIRGVCVDEYIQGKNGDMWRDVVIK